MNSGILLLCLVNFGYIALLPRKFFKQGAKLNRHFWLTAAPLFACPALLGASFLGYLPPFLDFDNPWSHVLGYVAVLISSVSIVLLGMAIGTHRVPIHMFHDEADTKVHHLVTYGPYRYIRHPIYSSYLLALFASMLFCPQVGTIATFVYGLIVLGRTAAKEEVRLCGEDEFGQEYVDYMKVSGRFLPPLSAFHMRGQETTVSSVSSSSDPEMQEKTSVH